MTDIVERLRQSGGGRDFPWADMREAADEIERLERVVEAARAYLSCDDAIAENSEHLGDLPRFREALRTALSKTNDIAAPASPDETESPQESKG